MGKQKYESDIELGVKYRDTQTGIVGTATAVYFFQFGCERVQLEAVIEGKIVDYTFDAPRLVNISTDVRATTTRTGGPGHTVTGATPEYRPGPH